MAKRRGKSGSSNRFYFLGLQSHCWWWLQPWNRKNSILLNILKDLYSQSYFLVVMYGYENWTIKKAECWRIDAFELWCWKKLLRIPWTSRRIKLVCPKGNQLWIFIGKTNAEVTIIWLLDAKSQHIGKDSDAGKDWRREEKGTTEDEMVGWHHRLNGHGFEPTSGDCERQGSLVCCSPLGLKELDPA